MSAINVHCVFGQPYRLSFAPSLLQNLPHHGYLDGSEFEEAMQLLSLVDHRGHRRHPYFQAHTDCPDFSWTFYRALRA